METIKSFTSIEQSKKLADILPLESADMWFANGLVVAKTSEEPKDIKGVFPCWSLVALLDALPNKLRIALAINDFQGARKEKYSIGSVEHDKYDCFADNSVDACYEMIIKLHEQNLL